MKDYENDDDIAAFESELRKLKPVSWSADRMPTWSAGVPPALGAAGVPPASLRARRPRSQVLAGVLLGMLLGGGLVHFLQKPVVIEKIVVQHVQPEPVVVPIERPVERQYAQIPLDIDTMIERYNQRSKLLANLPPRYSSMSTSLAMPDDPNSLLQLRNSM